MREVALTARHTDECVTRRGSHDHVGRLARERLEPHGLAVRAADRASQVVAALRPRQAPGEPAREIERPRLSPLERTQRRAHEELERNQRRHGVPRQAEDQGCAADGERHRLSRPHGHAPEHLLRAERRERAPHQVLDAHRHPARRDEHIRVERSLEERTGLALVVGHRPVLRDLGARRAAQCRQQRTVGLVDLARLEWLAGFPQLATRRDDRNPRAWAASDGGNTGSGGGPDLGCAEDRAGATDDLTRANVATGRPDVVTEGNALQLDRAVEAGCLLDRHDRVGSLRHHRAGGNRDRLTGAELMPCGCAGRRTSRQSQDARRLDGPHGVTVHGRTGKRRQVDHRQHVSRANPAGSSVDRHQFGRRGVDAAEDEGQRFLDRRQPVRACAQCGAFSSREGAFETGVVSVEVVVVAE